MLLLKQSLAKPRAQHRLLQNWRRQMVLGIGLTGGIATYWEVDMRDKGK